MKLTHKILALAACTAAFTFASCSDSNKKETKFSFDIAGVNGSEELITTPSFIKNENLKKIEDGIYWKRVPASLSNDNQATLTVLVKDNERMLPLATFIEENPAPSDNVTFEKVLSADVFSRGKGLIDDSYLQFGKFERHFDKKLFPDNIGRTFVIENTRYAEFIIMSSKLDTEKAPVPRVRLNYNK